MKSNYHVTLKSRPGVDNEPSEDNFSYEECRYPNSSLETGLVLIRTLYLSMDPALRCRMNEDTGASYLTPWELGYTIGGLGGVGVVEESTVERLQKGDLVQGMMGWPWKLYFIADVKDEMLALNKIEEQFCHKPSLILSCVGIIGLTSLIGLQEEGHLIPGANQTCVVSGAAGACGTLAGQMAKLLGCVRVVGLCGTQKKCECLVDDLGFSSAINYRTDNVLEKLRQTCPNGVDVYFDNVGGEISNKVISQMNEHSHVVLCGQISQYNKNVPYPPPLPDDICATLKHKNITRNRFLVLNYREKYSDALLQVSRWLKSGELKVRETVEEGLQNSGRAFVSMMKGGNLGKQLVHVSDI